MWHTYTNSRVLIWVCVGHSWTATQGRELRVLAKERRLDMVSVPMILIPAGEFLMGSDPQEDEGVYGDEQPQHAL